MSSLASYFCKYFTSRLHYPASTIRHWLIPPVDLGKTIVLCPVIVIAGDPFDFLGNSHVNGLNYSGETASASENHHEFPREKSHEYLRMLYS